MALAANLGADVSLDDVPLKEEDMAPWEIWISESQERMMLAVKPENVDEVLRIFDKWDVLATPIGKAVKGSNIKVRYKGEVVIDLDLNFYTAGPVYRRKYLKPKRKYEEYIPEEPEDYEKTLIRLLTHPNIASKEWVIRQYDHQVRASTVLTPMQGMVGHETHGDAAVMKPREDSWKGLAISTGIAPRISEIDPYWGAWNAVDEAYRAIVAVGGRPHSLSDCLNFGNPENPRRFWEFRESVKALGDAGKSLGIPYASGNVSFYNESPAGAIPPTPTVMGAGIVEDIRKVVSSAFKKEGDPIYILGDTKAEMGGSLYYELSGGRSAVVPKVDAEALKENSMALLKAIDSELVMAVHDVSDGGIAVALSEMAFGGRIGADINVGKLGKARADMKVFSESPSRWLIEVDASKEDEFTSIVKNAVKIGRVGGKHIGIADFEHLLMDIDVEEAYQAWKEAIWKTMG
jgi:phosphoribosylformylglycinamidine synthase II